MNNLEVKIKKLHPNAVIPQYAKLGDAGLDLTAVRRTWKPLYYDGEKERWLGGYWEYDTGLALEIPEGYYGNLVPRSSVSDYDIALVNTPGTIDSSYRGSIKIRFKELPKTDNKTEKTIKIAYGNRIPHAYPRIYNIGDRVGQLIILPYPQIQFVESELSESERGAGGFGSTGTN